MRNMLEEQRCLVTVEFLPVGSAQARVRYQRMALARPGAVGRRQRGPRLDRPAGVPGGPVGDGAVPMGGLASRPWVWPAAKRYLRRLSDRRLPCDPDADCDTPLDGFLGFSSGRG
jgi:hypothetical protein